MTDAPTLFDNIPPVPPHVEAIHAELELRAENWLEVLRAAFLERYRGRTVSTDQLWQFMAEKGLELPAGTSPNALGSFFSAWSAATAAGWIRSSRPSANGNLLRTWNLEGPNP